MSNQICFYHGPKCSDGLVAAWAVWRHLNQDVRLIAMDYPDELPAIPQNKVVWLVDFTFRDIDFMRELVSHNVKVIHYDHHPSAEQTIKELQEIFPEERYHAVFTQTHSGAGITWRELFPDQELPNLVRWVEDWDLWRFNYAETYAFVEAFSNLDRTVEACEFANTPEHQVRMVNMGEALVRKRLERCQQQIDNETTYITLDLPDGERKSIPFSKLVEVHDASEQTNLMIKKGMGPIVGGYFLMGNRIKVRIGTAPDTPSAFKIAQHYGGGGHPHAAGFVIEASELPGLF